MLIIGDREMAANSTAVRRRSGEDLGALPVEAVCRMLKEQIAAKSAG